MLGQPPSAEKRTGEEPEPTAMNTQGEQTVKLHDWKPLRFGGHLLISSCLIESARFCFINSLSFPTTPAKKVSSKLCSAHKYRVGRIFVVEWR